MKQPHLQAANKAVLARDESNVYVCVRLADPTVETGEHMRAPPVMNLVKAVLSFEELLTLLRSRD